MDPNSSQTIDIMEDRGGFQVHRQVEYRDGMLFMRAKRRKTDPEV